jgi:hypothetical protein
MPPPRVPKGSRPAEPYVAIRVNVDRPSPSPLFSSFPFGAETVGARLPRRGVLPLCFRLFRARRGHLRDLGQGSPRQQWRMVAPTRAADPRPRRRRRRRAPWVTAVVRLLRCGLARVDADRLDDSGGESSAEAALSAASVVCRVYLLVTEID